MNVAFFTIVTKSHLAFGRVLAESVKRYHNLPFFLLVVDEPATCAEPKADTFTVLRLDDVMPSEFHDILFNYTAFELCNALKALMHRYFLDQTNFDGWIYLDSDILVLGDLSPALQELSSAPIVATPHLVRPVIPDRLNPCELEILKSGIYNGGFLALRRSADAAKFVEWFETRLMRFCFFHEYYTFVDQLWLNFLPTQFPAFSTLRHPGINVAYWNLQERRLCRSATGALEANAQPLLLVHFSKWSIDRCEDWTNGWPVHQGTDASVITEIGKQYKDALIRHGHNELQHLPYRYGYFCDGRQITKPMRRHYFELRRGGQSLSKSPFEMPDYFYGIFEPALPQRIVRKLRRYVASRVWRKRSVRDRSA
jgi:hypothetical protein